MADELSQNSAQTIANSTPNRGLKVFVAGHLGLVGSAILRELEALGYDNIVVRSRDELDLSDQAATRAFFESERPEVVYLAAAKVGGIGANSTYPADFISENLIIAHNVIMSAHELGVTKLCNLGSSCIYPRDAEQPIKEEALLTAPLEQTNEPYAVAKIAALKLCEALHRQYGDDFISLMPTNLYGRGDSYDLENSHVLPALIRRFHECKMRGDSELTLWGDGSALREFMHADDLAKAAIFLTENYSASDLGGWINVGSGFEVAIGRLANLVRDEVYKDANQLPQIKWDTSKPNGTPRKRLNIERLEALGWKAEIDLKRGIALAYADFLSRYGA